jgi:hypothetical protein
MSNLYYPGSMTRLSGPGGGPLFTDINGNAADPSTVSLFVIAPDGTSVTYQYNPGPIVRDGVGMYHYDLTLNQKDKWLYEWIGTGVLTVVGPGEIEVLPFPPFGWSYSGDPSQSAKDEVRFLIRDTDRTKPWTLQDAEIQYNIKLYSANPPVIGQNLLAAAISCEQLLGRFFALPKSKKVGDLSLEFDYKYLQSLAFTLRQRANLQGVKPYIGGVSKQEKSSVYSDPDRVGTAINIDGMSNPNATEINANAGDSEGREP